ncbi:transglycosylase SLT domain-containing protein [Palleronia caenipelagi]|uniref:Lytic transglycosylase n=1 Tax=Palleronia caenipelagi TaxID=2489174 RepID=A0A547PNA3_9RHOB|nr:transglycosylase SLT domain-containing protein [Palleronia caenipelagi]TRD15626.1 lytic transglycosylase [Palleronia caenipelagi]
MNRKISAILLALFVASCGGGEREAPRALDDACAIVDERPKYLRAMRKTEKKWGIPIAVQMATIHQESKFVGNARTPLKFTLGVIPMGRQSSAYGYSQALDGTWDEYKEQTGKRRAKRDDIYDATDFMGWYMDGTTRTLGISRADARNQYLAYHEGRGGYRRGSYRSKSWLVSVADKVATRAIIYDNQLRACGKR